MGIEQSRPPAEVLKAELCGLVDKALADGMHPRDVFSAVALTFGKQLSELVDPEAAAEFMQRETLRVMTNVRGGKPGRSQ